MSKLRLLERGVSAARKYPKERLFERVVPAARKYPKERSLERVVSAARKYPKQKTTRPSLISKYSKQKTARPLGNEEYWRHVNTLNKRQPPAPLRRKRKKAPGLVASPKTLKKIKRQRKLDNVKKKVLIGSALFGPGAAIAGTRHRKNIKAYVKKRLDSIRQRGKRRNPHTR